MPHIGQRNQPVTTAGSHRVIEKAKVTGEAAEVLSFSDRAGPLHGAPARVRFHQYASQRRWAAASSITSNGKVATCLRVRLISHRNIRKELRSHFDELTGGGIDPHPCTKVKSTSSWMAAARTKPPPPPPQKKKKKNELEPNMIATSLWQGTKSAGGTGRAATLSEFHRPSRAAPRRCGGRGG